MLDLNFILRMPDNTERGKQTMPWLETGKTTSNARCGFVCVVKLLGVLLPLFSVFSKLWSINLKRNGSHLLSISLVPFKMDSSVISDLSMMITRLRELR